MSTELTGKQADVLGRVALDEVSGENTIGLGAAARAMTRRLRGKGWTIEPPEPRFRVAGNTEGVVFVRDRANGNHSVRKYRATDVEPYDEMFGAAQAEADRLNNKEH